ncbi:N-methyl-L-tryptophan oxidase [Nesterenkonia muleiensis]|uniref:N-methyl-L-tryptophan oxidase n=1 Tax=Nesterenkonia muleiensis TaxID=2282648 RepID=UPI000E760E03|nr:N-methyl-L-tryptophan oxidase [Nesterenkonia muleiensis]
MTSKTRIGVVGLGTMGAQALKSLSEEKDIEVVGFEQFDTGHDRGAAGGESRIFRSIQFGNQDFVPILKRADELFKELETESGIALRELSGCVLMGPSSHQTVKNAIATAKEYDLDHELLDRFEAAERFPQFAMDSDDVAIYDRYAGFIRPELTIQVAVSLAEANGATVHRRTKVQEIVPDDWGVTLVVEGAKHRFDRVIVSTGPWVTEFLPRLADFIQIRRLISAWYPIKRGDSSAHRLPFIRLAPKHAYGVPSPDGVSVKVGVSPLDHLVVDNPDVGERNVSLGDLAPFDELLNNCIPSLNPEPIRISSYFEAYVDDSRPIIQTAPESDNVIILAAFSGHGFKFSPAIGEIGACLAMGINSDFDMSNYRRSDNFLE